MERRTVPELWREAVRDAPAGPAYLEETADDWRPVTRDEAAERVSALAQGLLARGVRHGDRVAVLSRTRLEWILLDWAVMSIGAVVVGLYPTSSAKECEYILDHCEAVLAFTEDDEQTRKLVSVRGSLPNLREIIPFDWLEKLESDGRLARHLRPEPVEKEAGARVRKRFSQFPKDRPTASPASQPSSGRQPVQRISWQEQLGPAADRSA
jgi:long-subunit acyl-CoA synthetase (AMP-forming)